MLTFFAYFLPSLLTIGLAFSVALMMFTQYRLAARVAPAWRLVCILGVVGAGALLSVLFTSRTLNETQLNAGVTVLYDDLAGGFAASRWLSLFLVAVASVELLRGWISRQLAVERDAALPVLLVMLLFHFGTIAVQAALSEHPDFSWRGFYVPLVLTALCFQRPLNLRPVLAAAKWVILTVTLGSLAAIFVQPEFVLNRPVPSWIPGVDWRLFGLTPHANALGPIALVAVVLEFHQPFKLRLLHWLNLGTAMAALLMAQSKTAWAAAVFMVVVVWVPLRLRRALSGATPNNRFSRLVWFIWLVIAALLLVAAGAVAFDLFDKLLGSANVMTVTGRTEIWDITLRAWKENLLFGFGPQVWGAARQLKFQMFHVGHAHNQLIQTLGEAGIAGLLMLLTYLAVLLHAALRTFTASRGVVMTLLVLLAVRCVTEAPLSSGSLLSWDTFLHALLLLTACHHLRENAAKVYRAPATAWWPAWRSAPSGEPERSFPQSNAVPLPHAGSGFLSPNRSGRT